MHFNRKVVKKGDATLKKGKIGKGFIPGADHEDPNERGMTKEQKLAYRTGARREGYLFTYFVLSVYFLFTYCLLPVD